MAEGWLVEHHMDTTSELIPNAVRKAFRGHVVDRYLTIPSSANRRYDPGAHAPWRTTTHGRCIRCRRGWHRGQPVRPQGGYVWSLRAHRVDTVVDSYDYDAVAQ